MATRVEELQTRSRASRREIMRWLARYSIVIISLLLFAYLSLANPVFFSAGNLINIARQSSPSVIIAVAMTLVIISAGIDLSVGAIVALAGTVAAALLRDGVPLGLAVLACLGVGAAVGLINGLFSAYSRIPPFIVTLASMSIVRGLALLQTGGVSIPIPPDSPFIWLGRGRLGAVPVAVLAMVLFIALGGVLLNRTLFGRYVLGVGGNEEALRLSGVNTAWVKLWVYVFSGGLAAAASVVNTARLANGSPNAGLGMELDAIAAVVLGGTSLFGGEGSIFGTLVGAFIFAMIGNGLTLLHVEPFYQQITKGAIILLAVWLNATVFRRRL